MDTSSKTKSLLVGLVAIAAASCGSPGADTEQVAVQAKTLTGLAPYRVRIQMIRVTDLSYSPASLTSALVRVNQLWAPLGIQFDFNHSDVVNRPDADCSSTESLAGIGNAIYGHIPLFICDDSASGPDHNSVKWEPNNGSQNLAHELGHYFDLDHTHGSAVVLEDQDWPMKNGKRDPAYISIETCIRAKFQNMALPLRCPNLSLGTAIRDAMLDGDGLPDTAISIEIMPPRLEPIRCTSNVFPLRVRFTDGRPDQDYSFLPGRDNLMGYLFCGTWNVQPSQLNLVRTALLTGRRSHLIRPFVTRETSFADTAGWNAEKYYATIGFPNVSGAGGDDVCGRGKFGINCATSDAGAFTDLRLWLGQFDDANGWDRPEHYRTIRYPNVNGGPADVCGRGIDGVYCAKSNGSTFDPATRWTAAFNNNDGFTAEKYYSTVEFPNVSAATGNADVCGRRADGLWCGISNGSGFSGPTRWEATLSDANGFDQPMYYRTIKYPNLNNSGGTDMCVRGTAGIYCALSNGSSFPGLSRWTHEFSNSLGWSTEKFYTTIQFADISGDGFADVCGRTTSGLYCGTSNGSSSFANFSIWGPDFSDANGWSTADSYQTITFVDLDRDGKVDVCGRVKDKLDVDRRGFYCAYSTGSSFTQYGKYSVSPSDQFGWSQPQYYRTLKFANIDGDAAPELCARGVFGVMCEP